MMTQVNSLKPRLLPQIRQSGVTMVELLVSMVLMGFVTLATVSLYNVTNSSYKTVDAGQQLNDNARFTFEIIGQALRVAGFQEFVASGPDAAVWGGRIYPIANCQNSAPPQCPILGFNNSKITNLGVSSTDMGSNGGGGVNLSDSLAITFAGVSQPTQPLTADGTMIDCQGIAKASPQDANLNSLGLSLFWVRITNGEPELTCTSYGATGNRSQQPVVRGMETFQVVYGVDPDGDSLPNRWVSAQDVTNWNEVRAVRVGFVLRGAPGSSQGQSAVAAQNDYYPLGKDFIGASTEAGFKFTPADDGRLRRSYATTFLLRNSL